MATTIDEAIRIHIVLQGAPVLKDEPRIIESLQLGIEALKARKTDREHGYVDLEDLLPGETKE